jgi:hypothetical protein
VNHELTSQVSSDWLGYRLLIKYLTGPDPDIDPDDIGRTLTGPLQARTELLHLVQIGTFGIVVKKVLEGNPEFISCGAVLTIQDVSPVEPDDVV